MANGYAMDPLKLEFESKLAIKNQGFYTKSNIFESNKIEWK